MIYIYFPKNTINNSKLKDKNVSLIGLSSPSKKEIDQ